MRDLPVIIMTAYSDLDSAVSAFQGGAFDYLPKPFDVPKAVDLIRRAVEESLHEGESEAPTAQVPEILGQAPAMQDVFRAIGRLSQSIVTVLITGESGSGKELVANALHKHSPRASGPFVAINTAAIPKDLLESRAVRPRARRLHRRADDAARPLRAGRRRHAVPRRDRRHAVRPADAPAARAGRRAVLSRRRPQPDASSNVRVIAATHQDLEARVKAGSFREDLFHRLNVIRLRLPALRERQEDIPSLTRFFLQKSARELGVEGKRITDAALARLTAVRISRQRPPAREHLPLADRDGAGAARRGQGPAARISGEAGSRVPRRRSRPSITRRTMPRTRLRRRAAARTPPPAAAPADAAAQASGAGWLGGLEHDAREMLRAGKPMVWETLTRRFEAQLIQTALEVTRGRRIEAAQKLGIGRNTITRKIQELGLDEK